MSDDEFERGSSKPARGSAGGGTGAFSGVTQEEIARFDAAFYGPDSGSEAELTVARLKEWLSAMQAPAVNDTVLRDICRKFNARDIDFGQMLQLLARSIPCSTTEEDMKIAFAAFDTDKSGSVSPAELRAMMHKLEERPTEQDIADIIQALDEDGDGQIDYKEFVKAMRGT